jgi:succinoglycan biosynthesis protein ExoO
MRATEPYISVIVPAYNVADCLERALNSVLDQTLADFEIIVVDDASEDKTLEVARRVATRDSRLIVLSNECNNGVSESRNRAIKAARGQWVAILDADDVWLPERLERMMAYAEGADVVSDDIWLVYKSYVRPRRRVFLSYLRFRGLALDGPKKLGLQDFVRHDLGALQPIFRRSFLKRHSLAYNTSLGIAEDFYLYFDILALGASWMQLPWAYYLYIGGRSGQATSDRQALWKDTIELFQFLSNHPVVARSPNLAATLKRRVEKTRETLTVMTIRNIMCQRRFTELAYAIRKQPLILWLVVKFAVIRLYLRVPAELQTFRREKHRLNDH